MPRTRAPILAAACLAIAAAAPAANAQLIVPTAQVREVRGEGTWTDASGTMGTGPLLSAAPAGDYGFWADTVSLFGFISGPAGQVGGFNGFDTIALDSITFSLGGGNGPGTSADANAAVEFTYTFDVPAAVTYTTSAGIGVAGPSGAPDTIADFAGHYTLNGPNGEVFGHHTGPENGYSIAVADATGVLPPGSYTLSFVLTGHVAFIAPADDPDGNGAGGGAGGGSPILTFMVAPAGACPVDWNNDSLVNSSDISAFLATWLTSVQNGTLEADFNGDQATNSTDISAFLSEWLQAVQQGC